MEKVKDEHGCSGNKKVKMDLVLKNEKDVSKSLSRLDGATQEWTHSRIHFLDHAVQQVMISPSKRH